MRIATMLIALAGLVLAAGCSDGDSNVDLGDNNNDNGNVGNLSTLVIQECRNMPEDRDPIPINGLDFAPGANDPNNQSFTNNCL